MLISPVHALRGNLISIVFFFIVLNSVNIDLNFCLKIEWIYTISYFSFDKSKFKFKVLNKVQCIKTYLCIYVPFWYSYCET